MMSIDTVSIRRYSVGCGRVRRRFRSGDGLDAGRVRRRRKPEEAERAILAAARSFLEERPFREMTVEAVMARTGLSRPAFYAYFHDRYDVVTRLLEGIGGLLFAVDRRWLVGGEGGGGDEAREVLIDALRRGSETFVRYGPVLRAIADAASYDSRVEEVYRFGLIERLVGAVATRISRDVEAAISPGDLDPEETARALVLMTERYLLDAFGRPEGRPSPERVAEVVGALEKVWVRTLYSSRT
jgi:TetR/AcrR family transcriptional regulator, ethionamide resistance regulator